MSLTTPPAPIFFPTRTSPVQWRTWGPEALAEAKAADKPILLSLGYAGCHWCHVMSRESFTDAEIAALINDNFIPILVDREERPDLDMLYQGAAGIMRHPGGWPLNIFLDPRRRALVGDRLSAARGHAGQSQLPPGGRRLRRAVEERPRPRRGHRRQGHAPRWSSSTIAT